MDRHSTQPTKFRVLLADDDRPFTQMLASHLRLDGRFYVIEDSAHTAEDAIRLAKRYVPDAVVLDWQMPNIGGIGAARVIRESDDVVCIMLLSGYREIMLDVVDPISAGIDALVTKTPDLGSVFPAMLYEACTAKSLERAAA